MATLSYSAHAIEMLAERGIDPEWVRRTVETPVVLEGDPRHSTRMRAFGPVPERVGRVLRVVYETTGDTVTIITAFLDRNRTL